MRVHKAHQPLRQSQLISPRISPSKDAVGEIEDGEYHVLEVDHRDGLYLIEIKQRKQELELQSKPCTRRVKPQSAKDLKCIDGGTALP